MRTESDDMRLHMTDKAVERAANGMPAVSVIVPVYKVEPYIHQCVDSVLAQTLTDFELILVDDGSPDGCGAICDAYAVLDSRVRVIHQVNGGQGKARNVGMGQAGGKYLIFLDGDDYWLPSTLERLYEEAEKNELQVLVFSAVPFWDGLKEPNTYNTYQQTVQNDVVKRGVESLRTALDAGEYQTSPCLRFYRADYIRRINVRFDEGIIHEDERFSFLAYLFADRVECIGDRLYQRRYRPGSSMTGRTPRNSVHGLRVALDGLIEVYSSRALTEQEEELIARYMTSLAERIRELYDKAVKRLVPRDAVGILKDARKTLKRATTVAPVPKAVRLSTYSLVSEYVSPAMIRKIRVVIRGRMRTAD